MVTTRDGPSPGWLKNLVMLVALAGWAAAVIATLAAGALPDPVLLGVPGGLYVALYPPRVRIMGRRTTVDEEE